MDDRIVDCDGNGAGNGVHVILLVIVQVVLLELALVFERILSPKCQCDFADGVQNKKIVFL
jgi:hypothetical protein